MEKTYSKKAVKDIKQTLVYELIVSLVPDDVATSDLIANHDIAMREYFCGETAKRRNGETVSHENIDWS